MAGIPQATHTATMHKKTRLPHGSRALHAQPRTTDESSGMMGYPEFE